MQRNMREKIMLAKAGSIYSYKSLIKEGCDDLFACALILEKEREQAKNLMVETYINGWELIVGERSSIDFDKWIRKKLLNTHEMRNAKRLSITQPEEMNWNDLNSLEKEVMLNTVSNNCGKRL